MNRVPNYDFNAGGLITEQFLSLGLPDFHTAIEYVWRLPYRRNSNRADYGFGS